MESELLTLYSYVKDIDEKVAKKIVKLNNLNANKLLYIIKERQLKKELKNLFNFLLKEDIAELLTKTNDRIDKLIYDINLNSGWSIGPAYCCYIDKMYYSGQTCTYYAIRGEYGYYAPKTDNVFVEIYQDSFCNEHQKELACLHQLYTIRESIMKNIDINLKDEHNMLVATAIGCYLGYNEIENIDSKVKKK